MRDENGRHVHLLVEPAQPVAQLRAHAGVERAERLVQEQHLGLHRERAGQRHPLALAARELRGVAVRERLQLDELEQLVDARSNLGLRPLAHGQPEADVVPDGHVLERRVVLEDEADPALLRRERGRVLARDHDLAGVRLLEPGDHAQERRLAAAARPEQRRQRARLDHERDVVERGERSEPLGHAPCLDHLASAPSGSSASRCLNRVVASSVATASSASRTDAAYVPTGSND